MLTKYEKELFNVRYLVDQPVIKAPFCGLIVDYGKLGSLWIFQSTDRHFFALSDTFDYHFCWPVPILVIDRLLKFKTICERYKCYASSRAKDNLS